MTDRKIEWSDGRCFGWQQLLARPIPSKISFHIKKKWIVVARNFFLKRACRCPQRLQPTQKRPVLLLARLTRPSRARARPKSGRWFCNQIFDYLHGFWKSLREWLPANRQGLELELKLELCRLANGFYWFHLLRNPRISCVEFEFFLGLFHMHTPKLRTEVTRHIDYGQHFAILKIPAGVCWTHLTCI